MTHPNGPLTTCAKHAESISVWKDECIVCLAVLEQGKARERAEAAELALQTLKEDVAKADKAAVKAMKLVVAQARQQAIADLIPQLEKSRQDSVARSEKWGDAKEHDKAQYWMGVAWGQADAIGLCRRSLTPPPALTKEK